MESIILIIREFGVPVALLFGFIFWAYKKDQRQEHRYDELGQRLNEVQDIQRTQLLDLTSRAITVQQELVEQFKRRPCLAEDKHV